MSYVLVLLGAIDVVVALVVVPWHLEGAPALLLYLRGRSYKESPWVGYNYSPSRTLSLGVILSPPCSNVGLCRPLHGPTELSWSCTLGTYPRHLSCDEHHICHPCEEPP
jgi:hypothetical protein